tara:strand:+ start:65 stop:361 length:297 start_codon:yes stop_codon:yes gene_type:complete
MTNTSIAAKATPDQKMQGYHQKWKANHPNYMSEWRSANEERMRETNAAYYQKHKARILVEYAKPVTCECGKTMRRNNYPRHLRSSKHKAFIENKQGKE